jgi:UDP-2,3-diacylglucosamine pyrophosphatase LpxH
MSVSKIIISDLHLADGHPVLDCFGSRQQSALEGLLNAASPEGPLGHAEDVELIINGDCFDLLVIPPHNTGGVMNPSLALEKLNRLINAHQPFFTALRRFIHLPGRHVTFLTGNHDIELCFAQVRARIYEAIGIEQDSQLVHFCPTRFYRPLPDVYMEHGNHYDFWNRSIDGLWNVQGQPLTLNPEIIHLPVGSRYVQHASLPISIHYPYFDHFEPSFNITRQMALLCLLDPAIVIQTVQYIMKLLIQPREPLIQLTQNETVLPAKLFEQTMLEFAAFQQDMFTLNPGWIEPAETEDNQVQTNAIKEFASLREALSLPLKEAIAAIFVPTTYQMGESVAAGMHTVLRNDSTLRYAIAGHTHMIRSDAVNNSTQTYLNTASWTTRVALPASDEITSELVAWLRQPDWQHIALQDVTQLVFALVDASSQGPSNATLCFWDGGINGHYHTFMSDHKGPVPTEIRYDTTKC